MANSRTSWNNNSEIEKQAQCLTLMEFFKINEELDTGQRLLQIKDTIVTGTLKEWRPYGVLEEAYLRF